MKKILLAVFFSLPAFCWGQSGSRAADAAKWSRARDYLSCRLSLEAIRSKVKTDTSIRARFLRVQPVLAAVTIEAPPSAAVLDGELHDFTRVRQVVADPIGRVDAARFAAARDGARLLVDTAFGLAGHGYVVDEKVKSELSGTIERYLADSLAKVAAAPVVAAPAAKPVIALGGQPDGQGAVARGRGFDWWVLLPTILLVILCVVLRQRYLEIKDELRARKVEMRSFNENYFGSLRGGASSGAGADRKSIERAVADSEVIAELSQAIGRLQLRISQLEEKVGAVPAGALSSGAAPAPASGAAMTSGGAMSAGPAGTAPVAAMTIKEKNKLRAVDAVKPADGADVFYMAGPVSNYFPNSAKSFSKDNTVYRFKVSPNKQDAEFELHTSGAPINEIVQLAESYIKAACDEENLPSYPVKNIITKKAGQAILEGDKWIIKSKALIRYE